MSMEDIGVPHLSHPNHYKGVASLWEEKYPEFQQTDAQFNIGGSGSLQRGVDIINPQTKERLYLAQGSDLVSENTLDKYFERKNIGASVLQLADTNTGKNDQVRAYVVPSGARLLAPSLKDPAYNERYLARLSQRIGSVMKNIQRLDPNLYGINLHSVAVIHEDEEVGDDTEFAIIPPLASAKPASEVIKNPVVITSFMSTGEYLDVFVESFVDGTGPE